VSGEPPRVYALRATPTVRRALAETLPEAVAAAAAAFKFITGPPLEQPHRVGKRLLPPLDDRYSARRGTYRVIYRNPSRALRVAFADGLRPPGDLVRSQPLTQLTSEDAMRLGTSF